MRRRGGYSYNDNPYLKLKVCRLLIHFFFCEPVCTDRWREYKYKTFLVYIKTIQFTFFFGAYLWWSWCEIRVVIREVAASVFKGVNFGRRGAWTIAFAGILRLGLKKAQSQETCFGCHDIDVDEWTWDKNLNFTKFMKTLVST